VWSRAWKTSPRYPITRWSRTSGELRGHLTVENLAGCSECDWFWLTICVDFNVRKWEGRVRMDGSLGIVRIPHVTIEVGWDEGADNQMSCWIQVVGLSATARTL
jgi:hypothetical protein